MGKIRFEMKKSTQIILIFCFILFFFVGIILLSNILLAFLGFGMSFVSLAIFLMRKRIFIELNEKGIVYVWVRGKIEISWDNIAKVKIEEERVEDATLKFLGINLKDATQLKSHFEKFYGYDFIIFEPFDIEKIEKLILKYWKNPELRKELSET